MFSKVSLSVINRSTWITKTSISCIDRMYVNSYYNQVILSGIIKTDLSDHFPIFIIDNSLKTTNFPDKITNQVRKIHKNSSSELKTKLLKTVWSFVREIRNSDQGTLKIEGRTTHKFVYTRLLKFLLYSRAIQIDPCCSVQALYRWTRYFRQKWETTLKLPTILLKYIHLVCTN